MNFIRTAKALGAAWFLIAPLFVAGVLLLINVAFLQSPDRQKLRHAVESWIIACTCIAIGLPLATGAFFITVMDRDPWASAVSSLLSAGILAVGFAPLVCAAYYVIRGVLNLIKPRGNHA